MFDLQLNTMKHNVGKNSVKHRKTSKEKKQPSATQTQDCLCFKEKNLFDKSRKNNVLIKQNQ